jgi:predicted XRE-type DNA-binding protein
MPKPIPGPYICSVLAIKPPSTLTSLAFRPVAEAVRQLSAKTKLIDQLIVARVAAGLTQSQMAAKLRCSQSRISKIEDSQDADLSLGDIQAYARIVGLKLQLDLR